MFKNIYPLFAPKHLLKKEMLENLRDYPRNMFQILYQDHSDGILAGCELTVTEDHIVILPGIVYFKGIPYVLEKEWKVEYEAAGRLTYLKIRFLDREVGVGQEEYLSRVYLEETPPEDGYEIELARFKLQPGARLRDQYTDFFDFNTEFDTINRIYAPFSSLGKHSVDPQILKGFSSALIRYPIQNPWDYPFVMDCMKLHTAMPYDQIKTYLNLRLGQEKEYSNRDVYEELSRILLKAEGKEDKECQREKGGRRMLLL